MKLEAELEVLCALRNRAREMVQVAEDLMLVDAASAEWKKLDRRIAFMEQQLREIGASAEDSAPQAVGFSLQRDPKSEG